MTRDGANCVSAYPANSIEPPSARSASLVLMLQDDKPHGRPADGDPPNVGRVQCPNCCQLAFVLRQEMGLLHYRCVLCLAVGAIPAEAGDSRG